MKSLMLQVISLFLLETNLRVFSFSATIDRNSPEFTQQHKWRDFVVAIS